MELSSAALDQAPPRSDTFENKMFSFLHGLTSTEQKSQKKTSLLNVLRIMKKKCNTCLLLKGEENIAACIQAQVTVAQSLFLLCFRGARGQRD